MPFFTIGMKLLIVESPSKAKTIEKYLDGAYTVRASVGHVRDLPKSNKKAIDIDKGFLPHYEISKGKEKVVSELKHLAEGAKEIMLATDPDREGEAIAWHIEELLKEDKKIKAPIKRVTFHEITKEAVEVALKEPRDIDTNLRRAQEARRVLDRLVGYDLSGIIWKKVRYGLSAGRVQSPALRIIMEREREIRAFIPEQYFTLEGLFETNKKDKITLSCVEEPRDQKIVDNIIALGEKEKWFVKDLKASEQKRSPRAPFTTSTLQQTASSRLGFSPSRTMQVAQKLYEAGFITYMRTDSTNLSAVAQTQILNIVEKKYGKEYAEARSYKTKSKNAQEAHEAIRPSHVESMNEGHNDEQKRLYRLIWERTVSSQMADAKLMKTKIVANIKNGDIPDFTANGSRVLFPGWLAVDTEARGEDVELPLVEIGQDLKMLELKSTEKFTEPPNRYTEAGLVKELESRGIGRPSTYASIMRTIEERGYVEKQGRTLYPTDTGDVVSSFLENNFAEYISDTFTAEMEDKLDDIANGDREYVKTLKDFYTPFVKDVKEKDKLAKATNMGEADPSMRCPKCDGDMIIKLSRTGKFLSCANYPGCVGARKIDGTELEGPKDIGKPCPKCGTAVEDSGLDKNGKKKRKSTKVVELGRLMQREGKFGAFVACSRYPKCKYVEQDEEEMKKKMTTVVCPVCKKGNMMERRGRFGIFYSCSNYPDCKNAIKAKPTGNICEFCQSLMMEGTKTIPERCSNKMCKNHNPHKIGENLKNNKK
ncbi:MAG: topoisomerase [Patescibacteria group bacterium]|nr:topoisomerase [Patescibacteria group bacterium]